MYFCESDRKCILKEQLCDGVADCADGMDEHECVKTKCSTSECHCPTNFRIIPEENGCAPLKMCNENEHLCDGPTSGHQCVNKPGGYECMCADGYKNYDKRSCLRSDNLNEPVVLCHNYHAITLSKLNDAAIEIHNSSVISGGHPMAYNLDKNYIVFITDEQSVYAAKLFTNEPCPFVPGQEIVLLRTSNANYIKDIKLDYINDIVLLVSEWNVEAFHVKNPNQTFIYAHVPHAAGRGREAASVALNPLQSRLYVATSDLVTSINLDGSDRKVVYNLTKVMADEKARKLAEDAAKPKRKMQPPSVKVPQPEANDGEMGADSAGYGPMMAGRSMYPEPWNNHRSIAGINIDIAHKKLYLSINGNFTAIDFHGKVLSNFNAGAYGQQYEVFGETIVDVSTGMAVNKHGVNADWRMVAKSTCYNGRLVHRSLQPVGEEKCVGVECDGLCMPTATGSRCIEMDRSKNFVCYSNII